MVDEEVVRQLDEKDAARRLAQRQAEMNVATGRSHTPAKVRVQERLGDLNLEEELVAQYHKVMGLQDSVMDDYEIPANQRAAVAAQVASTLGQLIKLQTDLKRDERLKKIEAALLEAIATLPEDVKDEFFRAYEVIAANRGVDQ